MNTKIGAHLSISGGYHNPLHKIKEIGGNCLQIFSASPRGWNNAQVDDETCKAFLEHKERLEIDRIYFHASYLVNLADGSSTGHLSKTNLINELNIAPRMNVKGSIIHVGSFKEKKDESPLFNVSNNSEKYQILLSNIRKVLEKIPENVFFIIENAGNRKIGQTLEEIGHIIQDINDPRLKVCLDTCHLHAAGYDLSTKEKFEDFLETFDSLIGLDRLEVIHLNDSRDPFGSLRDRHENLGEGHVGVEVFKNLLNHPKTRDLTFIIETPGFDDKGPDKQNVDILKSLIE